MPATDSSRSLLQRVQSYVCRDPLPTSLIKTYIAYAKQHCHPVLQHEAKLLLKDFYLELRQQAALSPSISITVCFDRICVRQCPPPDLASRTLAIAHQYMTYACSCVWCTVCASKRLYKTLKN